VKKGKKKKKKGGKRGETLGVEPGFTIYGRPKGSESYSQEGSKKNKRAIVLPWPKGYLSHYSFLLGKKKKKMGKRTARMYLQQQGGGGRRVPSGVEKRMNRARIKRDGKAAFPEEKGSP